MNPELCFERRMPSAVYIRNSDTAILLEQDDGVNVWKVFFIDGKADEILRVDKPIQYMVSNEGLCLHRDSLGESIRFDIPLSF